MDKIDNMDDLGLMDKIGQYEKKSDKWQKIKYIEAQDDARALKMSKDV